MKYTIGVDLGGTNIAVGIVNENYEIVKKALFPLWHREVLKRSFTIWLSSAKSFSQNVRSPWLILQAQVSHLPVR
jgi:uncharacterized hydantoinase/oxoprolinase family protein